MRAKAVIAVVLVALVSLLVVVSPVVLAQGPDPDAGSAPGDAVTDSAVAPEGVSPAVALGQPGLSYRYDRTYGETLVPYLADTSHIFLPAGVAVDTAGNVYVDEEKGHRMLKYAPDGTFLMSIGQAGVSLANNTNRMATPSRLAVDAGGNIWIAERWVSRVSKWSSTGAYVTQLGTGSSGSTNDRLRNAEAVALDETRGLIYVADTGNHRVQVFTSAGVYTATIGSTGSCGTSASQFCSPRGVAVDSSGRVYVADSSNHRVQVFDSDRNYITTLNTTGTYGSANNQFNTPYDVEIGPDGSLYVADRNNHRVQVFTSYPPVYTATIGQGHCGSGNDHLCSPTSVAVNAAGSIYVADIQNHRVQAFSSGGIYQRTFGVTGVPYLTDNQHFETPVDVTLDPSGNLIVLENTGQRFLKLTSEGTALFAIGAPGAGGGSPNRFCNPGGVATDGGGRIYVADDCNNYVQVYGPNSLFLTRLGAGYGTGNDQFKGPAGVSVGPDGKVYVADRDNHRVQVYGPWPTFAYLGALGVTGVPGTGSNTFSSPNHVAVDAAGDIYVADTNNHRIQKCTLSGGCTTFAGVTGSAGNDFGRLNSPTGIAVDATRVYVADKSNDRIQVFDLTGAYLTTIGGASGQYSGRLQTPSGVAVDPAGYVYVADYSNARIQRFAPGVPGWVQANINGFGDRTNGNIHALEPFSSSLYAGTYNVGGNGAQIWRMDSSNAWTQVITPGFGITRNVGMNDLVTFGDQLYVGVRNDQAGASVYRTADGDTWLPVATAGFTDTLNAAVYRFAVFNGQIYAGTGVFTTAHGAEIWRSPSGDSGTWTQVVSNGFGDPDNYIMRISEVYSGSVYFGTQNTDLSAGTTTGGVVVRSSSGDNGSWTQVSAGGFGEVENYVVSGLASFNGYLYASTARWGSSGSQVWRCQTCDTPSSWQKVVDNGFGDPYNGGISNLQVFEANLYLVIGNSNTGLEVWRSASGNEGDWTRVLTGGFGDSNNTWPYYTNVAVHNSRLYIATQNGPNAPEIWKKTVTAGFTASPVIGPPPLSVSFTNQSAGDVTTTLWDFGDGVTSAVISPTHEYTRTGVYTVTLTVGDGVDTSVITRPAYVRVGYRAFLPLVLRTYDALLYDDFGDAVYDGIYHPGKWQNCSTTGSRAWQQAGTLVITNTTLSSAGGGCLRLVSPAYRTLAQVQVFEAKLKLGSDRTGGGSNLQIHLSSGAPGHDWIAQCKVGGNGTDAQATAACDVLYFGGGGVYIGEYSTPNYPVTLDTWVTARMEVDPATANFRFFMNGTLIGNHTPSDAAALIIAADMQPKVSAWSSDLTSTGTKYVDDVRITPVQP